MLTIGHDNDFLVIGKYFMLSSILTFFVFNYLKFKIKLQEVIFGYSQIFCSINILKIYFDTIQTYSIASESEQYTDYNHDFGDRVTKVLFKYYFFDVFVLNSFKFVGSFNRLMTIHHTISIITFYFLRKYYYWSELTILFGTIWKIADIPQAFYNGWVIPKELIGNYKDFFGRINVSIRISSYTVPILIKYIKGVNYYNNYELKLSIIIIYLFQFVFDSKTTMKFITDFTTWIYVIIFASFLLFYY